MHHKVFYPHLLTFSQGILYILQSPLLTAVPWQVFLPAFLLLYIFRSVVATLRPNLAQEGVEHREHSADISSLVTMVAKFYPVPVLPLLVYLVHFQSFLS